jgi:nitrogen fixation/metabolism regulation signal transduction histidine kinase
MIQQIAGDVPPEWTGNDWDSLRKLTEAIVERRSKVRELITAFRNSTRQPFPAWGQRAAIQEASANVM